MKKGTVFALLGAAVFCVASCGGEIQDKGAPAETLTPTQTAESPSVPTAEPETEVTPEPAKEAVPTPATSSEEADDIIRVGNYKGLILTNVSEETVDEEIRLWLEGYADYVVVDRPAEYGDYVNINYVGTIDGAVFEGGTNGTEEGSDLQLGTGEFIEGFEEGLIGACAGETRVLTLTFPDSYERNPELAGKEAEFTVTVNEVFVAVLPEFDDAFVAANVSEDTTAAEFRQTVYDLLNEENLAAQAADQLFDSSEFIRYPETEIKEKAEEQVEAYMSVAGYYAAYYGTDAEGMLPILGFDDKKALEEYAYAYAEYLLKSNLVMSSIAKKEQLEVTSEEYEERALLYAQEYGYTDIADFEADFGKEEIEEAILYDIVIEFVIRNAVIMEKN